MTGARDWLLSNAVALLALGLSLWAIARSRPRLAVATAQDAAFGGDATGPWAAYTVRVTVVNESATAVTVDDVGVRGYRDGQPLACRSSMHAMRSQGVAVVGPDLPHRVEGHDQATWAAPGSEAFRHLSEATHYRSYVQRYRRKLRRSPSLQLRVSAAETRIPSK